MKKIIYWYDINNKKHNIKKMETSYLINCLNCFLVKDRELWGQFEQLKEIYKELGKRLENKINNYVFECPLDAEYPLGDE